MQTVTKTYQDLPAAHRQPKHDGHCRLIHGHNWRFDITFICAVLDENGFVIDVGKLDKVKEFMVSHFDHTLLLNETDPFLKKLKNDLNAIIDGEEIDGQTPFAEIVTVPNCGMEGLAKFVYEKVGAIVNLKARELRVVEVTCWEDSKNRATYRL